MMFDCGLQNIFRLKTDSPVPSTGKTGTEKKEKAAWHPAILVRPEKVPRVSRK